MAFRFFEQYCLPRTKLLFIVGFLLCLIPFFQLASLKLNQIETEDGVLIYYSSLHEFVLPHILKTKNIVWNYDQAFWNYKPYKKPTIFVNDFTDYGNGGATGIPFNFVSLNLAPSINIYDVLPQTERIRMLATHEYTHVIAMDQATPSVNFFRNIFRGKPIPHKEHPESLLYGFLTVPRFFAPRWYHEGIAVFMETWQNHGVGRTMGSYDEMFFRALIESGRKFYLPYDLEAEGTAIDFTRGAISYLYGTRFVSYLAINYGPEKVVEWFNIYDSRAYSFSRAFENTFNKKLVDAWEQWIDFEKSWQEDNLKRISENPLTRTEVLNPDLNGAFSSMIFDRDKQKIYAAFRPNIGKPQLIEISLDGSYRTLTTISNSAAYIVSSIAYNKEDEILFYTTNNWSYRYLWQYDIRNDKRKLLIRSFRTGNFAFRDKDKTLWGVRHNAGVCTLVKLEPPYTDWTAIKAFRFGKDLYDLNFSPDGEKLLATISEPDGSVKIVIFDMKKIEKNDFSYEIPVDFGHSAPNNFIFTENSEAIYGTTYYTGVSNIFYHNLEDNKTSIVTNIDTGLFKPIMINDSTFVAQKFTNADGLVPVFVYPHEKTKARSIRYLGQEIVNNHEIVKEWAIDYDQDISFLHYKDLVKDYNLFRNIGHLYSYPFVAGYKSYTAFGIHSSFSDRTSLLTLTSNLSYTPSSSLDKSESVHWDLQVRYLFWDFFIKHNYANFYDLFGPIQVSRKGTQVGLTRKIPILNDESVSFYTTPGVSAHFNADVVSGYQNISKTTDNLYTLENTIVKSDIRSGSLTDNHHYGYEFNFHTSYQNVDDHNFYKAFVKADTGVAIPDLKTSFWLRTYTGKAFGKGNSPFRNFYFGGFRNNYIDHREPKQYRVLSAFPGTEINEIKANNFTKIMFEINLPDLYSLKSKNLHFIPREIETSLFFSLLQRNIRAWSSEDQFFNIGAQIDISLILLSQAKSTLSAGYAKLYHNEKFNDEFMISFSILR